MFWVGRKCVITECKSLHEHLQIMDARRCAEQKKVKVERERSSDNKKRIYDQYIDAWNGERFANRICTINP